MPWRIRADHREAAGQVLPGLEEGPEVLSDRGNRDELAYCLVDREHCIEAPALHPYQPGQPPLDGPLRKEKGTCLDVQYPPGPLSELPHRMHEPREQRCPNDVVHVDQVVALPGQDTERGREKSRIHKARRFHRTAGDTMHLDPLD